jgi:hypothetical protein
LQVLFAVTLFVSAALLFFVQPLIAKIILPYLGGSPAVWNTCMVFFQSALLAGYAFVHFVMMRVGTRAQVLIQAVLLFLPMTVLPLGLAPRVLEAIPHDANPIPWLLELLFVSVGLPFFVVSTSAPLLQKWFSATGHPAARDPYFLYGASNLGSMVALLGYPLLVEPQLRLGQQAWLWTVGYGLLVLLVIGCGVALWQTTRRAPAASPKVQQKELLEDTGPLTWQRRLRWLVLAFVPSSLLLGVTSYFSTDIAAIPLLWVVPLSLYLLTFVLVFTPRLRLPYPLLSRGLALATLLVTIVLLSETEPEPVWVLILIHLALFFLAALVCHGELAQDRPAPRHLSEFYLWMSLGGVLGGLFNALIAPLVFDRIAEYPLAMVLACLCRPRPASDDDEARRPAWWTDVAWPVGLGALTALLILTFPAPGNETGKLSSVMALRIALLLGLPAVLCYLFVGRPVRFALGVGAIMIASTLDNGLLGRPLRRERNFFGTLRITRDPRNRYNQLVHGNTLHGRQHLDEALRDVPLSYYHRSGPVGQFFDQVFNPSHPRGRVGVIGLGIGSIAAYAQPEQQWTFYEIDPAVDRVASDTRYFTFLEEHRRQLTPVELGDARLRLQEAADHTYDLIIIDAFNSDAIPVHLLTQQALRLYMDKLKEGGLMFFNISNLYLDLQPVLGNLARHENLYGYVRNDTELSAEQREDGKEPSIWAVLCSDPKLLGPLLHDQRWRRLPSKTRAGVWTDDFSNIWSAFRWK